MATAVSNRIFLKSGKTNTSSVIHFCLRLHMELF